MQDRVSRYPGRVRLTPVSGQANVYDMELADSPSVAGTPLNKANLLTDATATAMGLTSSATPNTAFNRLNTKIDTNNTTLTNAINQLESYVFWEQIGTADITGLGRGDTFSITLSKTFGELSEILIIADDLRSNKMYSVGIEITTFPRKLVGTPGGNSGSSNVASGIGYYTNNINESTGFGATYILLPNNDITGYYISLYQAFNNNSSVNIFSSDVFSVRPSLNKIDGNVTGDQDRNTSFANGTITVYGRSNP